MDSVRFENTGVSDMQTIFSIKFTTATKKSREKNTTNLLD